MEDREIRIEYIDYAEIKRWPRNPKDHDIHEIKRSINRFGFIVPVVFDETTQTLVAGHGRLDTLAFIQRTGEEAPVGIKVVDDIWQVPVIRGVAFDDPAEAESFLLADNRIAEVGGWKNDLLDTMLQEMGDVDGLLEGTGFDIADALTKEEQAEIEGEIEHRYTDPYNKIHVLLSFEPALLHQVTEHVEALKAIEGVECNATVSNEDGT